MRDPEPFYFYACEVFNPTVNNTTEPVVVAVWNPHSTRKIKLFSLSAYMADFDSTATWSGHLKRTTTRGTVNKTCTPNGVNERDQASSPPSGFVIDGNYTSGGDPTAGGPGMYAAPMKPSAAGSNTGSGFKVFLPFGLIIPPGTGIGVCFKVSAAPASFGTDCLHVSVEVED